MIAIEDLVNLPLNDHTNVVVTSTFISFMQAPKEEVTIQPMSPCINPGVHFPPNIVNSGVLNDPNIPDIYIYG